jgi:hypothetical protein
MTLLVLAPVAWAQDDDKNKPPDDPKPITLVEELRSLQGAYSQAILPVREAYEKAESEEAKKKVVDEMLPPIRKEFAEKYLALAEKYPDDPGVLGSFSQALGMDSDGEVTAKVLAILSEKHLESEGLVSICQTLARLDSKAGNSFLKKLVDSSPHKNVQAMALYGLGTQMKNKSENSSEGAESLQAEAVACLERVAAEYGDVSFGRGTLGDRVKGDIEDITLRGIGKVAPEIEGEDVDGTAFKLSDYRGKVVVIDFWGDW